MHRPSSNEMAFRVQWRAALRAAGLRCTEQRLAVLQHLHATNRPLSHRELFEQLARFGWDKATIFRNLNDLFAAGLVTRLELGDHVFRFEMHGSNEGPDQFHPHFLCTECGRITCLGDGLMQQAIAQIQADGRGHEVSEVLFKGRCEDCQPIQRSA